MKHLMTFCAVVVAVAMTSCSQGSGNGLADAGALADSIAKAEANGAITVDAPNMQASFTVADPSIAISCIGQELFNVFAAQELKKIPANDIYTVCDALRKSKGDLTVIISSVDDESVSFTLTPQQIVNLQRAKHSELNLGAARNQLIAVAERMVPAPQAHVGALRVDVSVSKSFLEYDIVWPKVSAYEREPQGILTKNYFNALKEQYQAMGGLAEPAIEMMTAMGIDGVRIVYSAENSDKQLKQAFPWREIRKPVE